MRSGKAEAYSSDYAAISGLQKIAGKFGIAIVIAHHLRKMEADDAFDTVSGTLGLTGAADTILILKRQGDAVTLYARGRDIEEKESAVQFNRHTCRWAILGDAAEVHVSNERGAILKALGEAGSDGLAVSEIMAATGKHNRHAMDALLYKMGNDGNIVRVKRGVYAASNLNGHSVTQGAVEIVEKERSVPKDFENKGFSGNLTNLNSDLTERDFPAVPNDEDAS